MNTNIKELKAGDKILFLECIWDNCYTFNIGKVVKDDDPFLRRKLSIKYPKYKGVYSEEDKEWKHIMEEGTRGIYKDDNLKFVKIESLVDGKALVDLKMNEELLNRFK